LIYSGLCIHSQTIAQHGKKGSEVEIDRKVREGIWGAKEEIYKKTSISSTRFKQKNKNRD